LEIIFFIALGFFVGSSATVSPFYGDINVIDEGQFAAWANFMLHGKLMFKDMYIVYGPLYIYPLYLLFKFFSPSMFLVRSYLVASSLIGIIPINLIMKELKIKFFSRTIMNLLIVFLPIMLLRQAVAWIALYFLVISINRDKRIYVFLAGLFTSITLLTSPELGIIVGVIFIAYCLLESIFTLNLKKMFFSLVYFALGFILPSVIFVAFSVKEGWFNAYVINTTRVLFDYSGVNVPNGKNLPNIFILIPFGKSIFSWIKFVFSKEIFIYYVFILHLLFILYLTIKFVLRKFNDTDKKLLLIVLFGIFLQYLLIGRPDHYFFSLSPILLLSVFYFNKSLIYLKAKNLPTKAKNQTFFAIVLLVLSIFSLRYLYVNHPQIENIIHIPSAVINTPNNPQFIGRIVISKKQQKLFGDLQSFVDDNSSPKDNIFVFSDEPALYLILNRDNATKYVVPFGSNLKSMRIDMLNELKNNDPKFILIDKNAWNVDDISNVKRLPEIVIYIKQNYALFKTVDGVMFYRNEKYE